MKEILFRGKTINSNEWVESMTISFGTIKRKRNDLFMEISENKWVGVIPETVGQFVGLTDKNGVKIFEGDILKVIVYSVDWEGNDCSYMDTIVVRDVSALQYDTMNCIQNEFEIIGNIHENPELLKP